MKIRDLFAHGAPLFSFEFFPPKTPEGVEKLYRTVRELESLNPAFVSVTYGAGGGTRDLTLEIVRRIKHKIGIESAAHLTCVGHSRAEVHTLLREIVDSGIENVVALRGDPPPGVAQFTPAEGGFRYAAELIAELRREGYDLCVAAAAYPEGHTECEDRKQDLLNLRNKVRAGVDVLITQLFYDNAFYFDFVGRARAMGIDVPIVPGIMPLTTFEQIDRITRMCGATIPMRLLQALERVRHDPDAVLQLGVSHASLQCADLLERGAPGIHFYTLNRSPATRMILTALQGQLAAR